MAVPVRAELLAQIDGLGRRALGCWARNQDRRRTELRSAARALPGPDRLLGEPRQRVDLAAAGLLRGLKTNAHAHRTALARLETRLAPQAPGARLARLGDRLTGFGERLGRARTVLAHRKRDTFAGVANRLAAAMRANAAQNAAKVTREREAFAGVCARADRAMSANLDRRYASLERLSDLLAAFSYHGVLARGFALVRDEGGRPLRSASAVAMGSRIDIEFADGRLPALATGGVTSGFRPQPIARRKRRMTVSADQGNLFDG
jgi:exodeoxyribonuclease VII large subunit